MSMYDLPPVVTSLLPFLGAAALAALVYFIAEPYMGRLLRPRNKNRLNDMAEDRHAAQTVARERTGSSNHKLRLLFAKFGIDAAGSENSYLWMARLGVGVIAVVVLLVIGLPPLSAMVGLVMGYVFINGLVTQTWNGVKNDVESEIPTFLNSLAGTLKVAPSVPAGVERVADALKMGGPLRDWAVDLAKAMQAKGVPAAIIDARDEAAEYSPSLVAVLALIDRMYSTGGEGYSMAFVSAAENMESVLDARVNARASGSSERGVLYFLMFGAVALSAMSLRNEAFAPIVSMPLVQLMYAGIFLVMTYGLTYINNLIDTVV